MLTLGQKIEGSKIEGSTGDNLNLMRLLLAITVIFSHTYGLGLGGREPFYQWTHDVSAGTLAVYAFFFISGFLITGSWQRSKSFIDFLIKRVLRIYPGFVVAMIFCAVLIWTVCPEFKNFTIGQHGTGHWIKMVAHDAALLQSDCISDLHAFAHNPRPGLTNATLWSIPVEFGCYLAVLVAGLCGLIRSRWLVLMLTALWYQVCIMMLQQYNDMFDQLYLCFACGAVAWLWKDKIPFSPRLAAAGFAALVLASHYRPFFSIAFPVAGGYCLLWLAYAPKLPLARWASRTDLSYGTYLYGGPIQQILISYVATYPILQSNWINFLIATPVALVLAFISWTIVEKPCLSLKRFCRERNPSRLTADSISNLVPAAK